MTQPSKAFGRPAPLSLALSALAALALFGVGGCEEKSRKTTYGPPDGTAPRSAYGQAMDRGRDITDMSAARDKQIEAAAGETTGTRPATPTAPVAPAQPTAPAAPSGPSDVLGDIIEVSGLAWKVPEGWRRVTPRAATGSMAVPRAAEIRISDAGGEAEVYWTAFRAGSGGDGEANVRRWASMMRDGANTGANAAYKSEQIDVAGVRVTLFDSTGMFMGSASGMGGSAQPTANMRMLAALIENPSGSVSIRLLGPAPTVAAAKDRWDAMIRQMKVR